MSITASEMTPADIAAVTNNNGGSGMGNWGDGAWWIIILLLFGWGRGFGGGGYGGNSCGNGGSACATQADVRAAVDQQTLISKLDQQTYGLADSTYAINNTINQNFRGVDNAICTLGYNIQGGFNGIQHSMDKCCCETQRLIERGFADTNYNLATQACDTRHAIYNSTRDIIDNQNANSRAILDFLTKDKIDTLQSENLALRFRASQSEQNSFIAANQEAQTAELIRRFGLDRQTCPIPAYVVPNPNCCYQYNVASANNCGCGGNF